MHINMLNILLQAAPGGGFNTMSLLFFGGMIVVMWLFMIRPQTKKAKEQKDFISNLREGDKVVSIAGIHGTISRVNDDNTLKIQVSPGTFITMERSAVSREYTVGLQKPAEATK
jgi:preprotein translocase subunit YajC